MIILYDIKKNLNYYLIPSNKDNYTNQYVIGRKNSNILIDNDKSVSRHHCTLRLYYKDDILKVTLQDHSKIGTKLNESIIKQEIELSHDCVISVGVQNYKFKLVMVEWSISTIGFSENRRVQIQETLKSLGINYSDVVTPQQTHILCREIRPTAKILKVMLLSIPLLSIQYLDDISQLLSKTGDNVVPYSSTCQTIFECDFATDQKYLSPITNDDLVKMKDKDQHLFNINPTRISVFKNLTFIFLNSNENLFNNFNELIEMAGGTGYLFDLSKFKETRNSSDSKEKEFVNYYLIVNNVKELDNMDLEYFKSINIPLLTQDVIVESIIYSKFIFKPPSPSTSTPIPNSTTISPKNENSNDVDKDKSLSPKQQHLIKNDITPTKVDTTSQKIKNDITPTTTTTSPPPLQSSPQPQFTDLFSNNYNNNNSGNGGGTKIKSIDQTTEGGNFKRFKKNHTPEKKVIITVSHDIKSTTSSSQLTNQDKIK
ncbi:hypothetical protein DLAC_00755 [Tieghemostelium lacteum]|uniref:FHA domain-containing protein n=1 Tax=Tieghemostelium lacteum TaxID=361077 RepID=A0A152A6X5_TIELA|nr:hypothetical protein DLAC_00755 [Tieghemostelium lacteum]|eukprot:KYR01964.1 hypothetical protein DLAC_00755 [Tieghemostelium lacteum]